MAASPTSLDSSRVIGGPLNAASMSCVNLIRLGRLIRREKKGRPTTLFEALSGNRPGLLANRRSLYGGRSRPRQRPLDEPVAPKDCRGTSAARLSRKCHRRVSALGTPSLGKSQGLQDA